MAPENEHRKLTPAELRARLVGNSLDYDREDIRYWQQASEQEHGEALYELLQFAQNVIDSSPERLERPLTFPGFRRRPTPPAP